MNRRSFLLGATGLLAAPAIVRVASIMPVKALPVAELDFTLWRLLRAKLEQMEEAIERDTIQHLWGDLPIGPQTMLAGDYQYRAVCAEIRSRA